MNLFFFKNKEYYEDYYRKTQGFYPFFLNCPKKYYSHFLKRRYFDMLGMYPDLENPTTLNEKMRWLLYNEQVDLHEKLTDKIQVKDWCTSKIGKNHISEIYGIWKHFDDINFEELPDKFALKVNHGCRMNLFIKNKKTFLEKHYKASKQKIEQWLKTNYYYFSLEPQYKNIKPLVFAEELRETASNIVRDDMLIHCFNSEPLFIENFITEYNYNVIYNKNWEIQPFTIGNKEFRSDLSVPRPKNLDEMLECAKILSKDFSYVRVDFANTDKKTILSEMTFSPCSAIIPFFPAEYDKKLGKLLHINRYSKC